MPAIDVDDLAHVSIGARPVDFVAPRLFDLRDVRHVSTSILLIVRIGQNGMSSSFGASTGPGSIGPGFGAFGRIALARCAWPSVAAAAAKQHDAIGANLRGLDLLAFLVGPLARLDAVLRRRSACPSSDTRARTPRSCPRSRCGATACLPFLALAIGESLGRGEADGRDRRAACREPHFRVATEIADQNRFVHTAHGRTS